MREPDLEEFVAPTLKLPNDDDVKKIRQEIFSRLGVTPIAIDEIIQQMQVPPKLLNIALVQLELADKIVINFGKVALKIEI